MNHDSLKPGWCVYLIFVLGTCVIGVAVALGLRLPLVYLALVPFFLIGLALLISLVLPAIAPALTPAAPPEENGDAAEDPPLN